jgi:hypothetical protein
MEGEMTAGPRLDPHEAMVLAMARRRRFTMTAEELAIAVKEDDLYLRADEKAPARGQILARAQNKTYRSLFQVAGPRGGRIVRLRRK